MRITTPLLLLFVCLNSVSGYGLNFVRFVTNFFIHPALLDDWEYAPAVGAVLLLVAIAVAQYGFLPIRPARLVAKLESRYLGRTERRHGRRRPRQAGDTERDMGGGDGDTAGAAGDRTEGSLGVRRGIAEARSRSQRHLDRPPGPAGPAVSGRSRNQRHLD
ncbi:uncharacterized protein LOC122373659 [Amphibalanus amphitrite]|uniref:uncharacterized protein LOC122373659 n=1 Tax=Amphibalanus amphitrite TaxID=1232801 RepID=UPI001C929232|nr:uncharacterized protein LOC122373659 [Amphibalanus amphitrite]